MSGAIACWIVAGVFAIGIAWLLVDRAISKFHAWRERRAMRIRNAELQRYNITPFFGTKERRP